MVHQWLHGETVTRKEADLGYLLVIQTEQRTVNMKD